MIDLIHLERLRQQRLRYESTQRQLVAGQTPRAAVAVGTRPGGRRSFLRIVSAVLVGWAVDGTVPRSRVTWTRR